MGIESKTDAPTKIEANPKQGIAREALQAPSLKLSKTVLGKIGVTGGAIGEEFRLLLP